MQTTKTITLYCAEQFLASGLQAYLEKHTEFTIIQWHKELKKIDVANADILLLTLIDYDIKPLLDLYQSFNGTKKHRGLVYAPELTNEKISQLFEAGIRGYVPMLDNKSALRDALMAVSWGGTYFPDGFWQAALRPVAALRHRLYRQLFSDRQIEIMRLAAHGLSIKEIADTMYRSARTIEMHLCTAAKIAKVKSTRQLLLFALAHNIIESPFDDHSSENELAG